MSDNKSKKMPGILARLRMVVGLNIGTIMFGILFIYMAFSAILYFTTTHIESYQVTSGPLSRNETYTGLAIREESLCKADSSGYITYYAREGSKINASGAVYGLSDTKTASAPASLAPEELSEFSKNTQTHMRMIDGFYFSTRYPGDDSIEIDGDDVETCNDAIELCRKEVLELERKLKKDEV